MTIGIADKRPPFVQFEERELGINAEASERAGRPIPNIVTLACITPHGSKDRFEKVAEEWLKQIRAQAMTGSYPLEWVNFFEAQYGEWKKGNELPREGTPTKTWQAATKEQSTRLAAMGYTTVEDVAQIPDSALGSIGPDGRYLRDLAKSWINEAKDKGINAKALADANVRIEQQEETIRSLRERMAALEHRLADQPKRGPGRPPRERGIMEDDAA
jgi:hypothetical protein